MAKKQKSNKPVAKIRAGKVQLAVWEKTRPGNNGGEEYIQKSVSIEKSYRDDNGDWQTTNSYFPNEIPQLIAVLQEAYTGLVVRHENVD